MHRRNGRGKTTFLHLLLENYPYGGSISKSISSDYFPYTMADAAMDTLSVVEGITDAPLWQIQREISYLNVPGEALFQLFETLSSGEQTKVLLGALFLNKDHFLLIDEPTNHLDLEGRETVEKYLRRKKGFILVSHDRCLLVGCVDHILSIVKTGIEIQKGNFSSWWENKERRDQYELAENKKLKREIRDLTEAARRTATWSDKVEKSKYQSPDSGLSPDRGYIGHKAAKMMQRSKAAQRRIERAAEEKAGLLKNIETAQDSKLTVLHHHKDLLAQVRDLSITYGNRCICNGIAFEIRQGERIALQGPNGSGKSSIIRLLLGMDIPFPGNIHIESGLQISYVPQDAGFLLGDMKSISAAYDLDEALFKAILRILGFNRHHFEKDLQQLSAGQKKKVLLAKSLCEKAHLYIWDEPINYIDVLSRMQIEKLLLPTLLFVEHDRAFTDKIAT